MDELISNLDVPQEEKPADMEPATDTSVQSAKSIEFEFLSISSENAECIKLYDACGREFPTNLRTSDVQYLLKQTYLNNLKASLMDEQKNKSRGKVTAKSNIIHGKKIDKQQRTTNSKFESVLRRGTASTYPNDYNFLNTACSSTSSWNTEATEHNFTKDQRLSFGKRDSSSIADRLKCQERFPSSDEYVAGRVANSEEAAVPSFSFNNQISLANLEKSFPPALCVGGSGTKKKPKTVSKAKAHQHSNSRSAEHTSSLVNSRKGKSRGKRCRKVYGTQNRHLWCRMCQWKKSCERFAGMNEDAVMDNASEIAKQQKASSSTR